MEHGWIIGFGNTSTDVEKTYRVFIQQFSDKKHLHGRGEDSKI